MIKKDLVRDIARRVDATLEDSAIFLEGFIESIEENVRNGETMLISGFGTFSSSHREGHKGTHPQNKDVEIVIEPYDQPMFKPSNRFKDYMNGRLDDEEVVEEEPKEKEWYEDFDFDKE